MTLHNKMLQRQDELNTRIRVPAAYHDLENTPVLPTVATYPCELCKHFEHAPGHIDDVVARAVEKAMNRYGVTHRAAGLLRESNNRITGRLREWLKTGSPTAISATNIPSTANLQCGDCGFELTKPSAYCPHCGASFGALYCLCGRQLHQDDKFCDNCGQRANARTQ